MADSPFKPRRSMFAMHQASPLQIQRRQSDVYNLSHSRSGIVGAADTSAFLNTRNASESFMDLASTLSERTTYDILEHTTSKSKTELLLPQFHEVLQAHNDAEVFDCVQDLVTTCHGVLDELQREYERSSASTASTVKQCQKDIEWLKAELNTWKLLNVLYHDRLMVQLDAQDDEMNNAMPALGASEKEIIAQLYLLNATLREYQLIVDWLETCYELPEHAKQIDSGERCIAWENTLFQLQHENTIGFNNSHNNAQLVKSLDPDAPVREKLRLHTLDEEDNMRLSRDVFTEIRRGDIEKAVLLCKQYGQTWRAVILQGWRLHEDPNYELKTTNEKIPIEGNPRRDIWKKCAWTMADSVKFDAYTRAIAGALCGHLESLKLLLNSSWQDLLWSYLKVQIDIRVESELRSSCTRSYYPMPDEYWNNKMTLEQIFDELLVAKDDSVRSHAKSHIGVIQQLLIVDNISELMQQMSRWLDEAERTKQPISLHELRFLTHIVLVMRQMGRIDQEQYAERVIATYVNALIERGESQLVAYYAAALPSKLHVQLYARFLEQITEKSQRSAALDAALQMGLDVENITRLTVETQRLRQPRDIDGQAPPFGTITEFDKQKISALEWLTFLIPQRGELLWQANAMIRQFLAESKTECVRQTFMMVPEDSLTLIFKTYDSKDNLPCREECCIKEYLCYKIYLAGIESFEDWTRQYHKKPQEPQTTASNNTNFTERMVGEHKIQLFKAELQRWETTLQEQTKLTTEALYNILLFPEHGWLNDPDTIQSIPEPLQTQWEHRQIQMEKLRSICIPEIALFLHKVLHESGDYEACVKIGDEIAAESHQLYKVYTKHKLGELLGKIAESSLMLLNKKLDPWGYPVTA